MGPTRLASPTPASLPPKTDNRRRNTLRASYFPRTGYRLNPTPVVGGVEAIACVRPCWANGLAHQRQHIQIATLSNSGTDSRPPPQPERFYGLHELPNAPCPSDLPPEDTHPLTLATPLTLSPCGRTVRLKHAAARSAIGRPTAYATARKAHDGPLRCLAQQRSCAG